MLTDTSSDVQRLQMELARRKSPAEKIAQVREMTNLVVALSRRAIARVNPQMTPQEIELRWVEIHYGRKLAAELRDYLSRPKPCNLSTPLPQ
jgi:hypothetical protein